MKLQARWQQHVEKNPTYKEVNQTNEWAKDPTAGPPDYNNKKKYEGERKDFDELMSFAFVMWVNESN